MSNFYLDKYGFLPAQIETSPSVNLGIVVVIPCFNEPDIEPTLNAIANCELPNQDVEVIIVVNSSETEIEEIRGQNRVTISEYTDWNKMYSGRIIFHLIYKENLPEKHAGVGLARKIGMDEAVSRFHQIDKDGIIVCFDADAQCAPNYLVAIENHFKNNLKSPGCSIHFEHPIEGDDFDLNIYQGIVNYELHLRYYNQCLCYCDLPYAFHTVGSSMAVKSSAYQKQGGMNKRKAGEDFYFLHKIIALGNFTELKNTKVIPSPRVSDRVPFGTGKAIGDWVKSGQGPYYSYNFEIFRQIKKFVSLIPDYYTKGFDASVSGLHPAFIEYFDRSAISDRIKEMKSNTKHFKSFEKRFFVWFDALNVLKLIHFMQIRGFEDKKLLVSVNDLLAVSFSQLPIKSVVLQLEFLRLKEKS